jgi:type IV pilus assembly protein PilV
VCVDSVPVPRRSDSGFTLIEILVALIILSIGLLGLEALGIGAARTLAMSEKQSEFTTIAATSMEELRASVINSPAVLTAGDSTTRVVATQGDTAVVTRVLQPRGNGHARLTVRVRPRSTRTGKIVQARPVQLDSYLFDTNLPQGAAP